MDITNIKTLAMNKLGRVGLVASKYSPEILTGIGIVGVVASTVMACKATLKAESVIQKTKENFVTIATAKSQVPDCEYTQEDMKKDMVLAYAKGAISLGRLYAPSVAVGAFSIACLLGAHGILNKRNAALMAAYKVVSDSFDRYRERVVEHFGEEEERKVRFPVVETTEMVTDTSPDEGTQTFEKKTSKVDLPLGSQYAMIFSEETTTQWKRNWDMNRFTLTCAQNHANDILQARGHLFLNEVLDELGMKRTPQGAVVGWVRGYGDDYVDFGLNAPINETYQSFANGNNPYFVLDFNVDGMIYDMI